MVHTNKWPSNTLCTLLVVKFNVTFCLNWDKHVALTPWCVCTVNYHYKRSQNCTLSNVKQNWITQYEREFICSHVYWSSYWVFEWKITCKVCMKVLASCTKCTCIIGKIYKACHVAINLSMNFLFTLNLHILSSKYVLGSWYTMLVHQFVWGCMCAISRMAISCSIDDVHHTPISSFTQNLSCKFRVNTIKDDLGVWCTGHEIAFQ